MNKYFTFLNDRWYTTDSDVEALGRVFNLPPIEAAEVYCKWLDSLREET